MRRTILNNHWTRVFLVQNYPTRNKCLSWWDYCHSQTDVLSQANTNFVLITRLGINQTLIFGIIIDQREYKQLSCHIQLADIWLVVIPSVLLINELNVYRNNFSKLSITLTYNYCWNLQHLRKTCKESFPLAKCRKPTFNFNRVLPSSSKISSSSISSS